MCCKSNPVEEAVPEFDKSDSGFLDSLYDFFYPDLINMTKEQKAKFKNSDVVTNIKTETIKVKDLKDGFMTAFRGGQVLGFVLVGLALLVLTILNLVYKLCWFDKELANYGQGGATPAKT
jgi:hypothetical protein